MNVKKDRVAEALEEFWGKEPKQEVQQVVQTVASTEDVITPEEAAIDYQSEGTSLKEKVEARINETQDLTPDPKATVRYTTMQAQVKQKSKNPFDLGGFDEMIQKQMSRERGFGTVGLGLGISLEKPMSYEEKKNKELIEFKIKSLKDRARLEKQERLLALREYAQQSQSRRGIESQLARSYKEGAIAARFNAGLPVYESPLDILAGGKRKVPEYTKIPIYDKEGKITGFKLQRTGEKIERYGGVFGAAKEVYKGYEEVAPKIGSTLSKTGKAFIGAGKATGEAFMKVGSYYDKSEIKNRIDDLFRDQGSSGKKTEPTSNKFVTRNPKEEIIIPRQETIISGYNRANKGSSFSDYDLANKAVNQAMGEKNLNRSFLGPAVLPKEIHSDNHDEKIEQIFGALKKRKK